MVREDADDARNRLRAGIARSLEQALRRMQDADHVPGAPGVGEGEVRRPGTRRDQPLDIGGGHALAGRPRRELVDLRGQLVEIVAHELDERPARLRLGGRAVELELVGGPTLQLLLRDVPEQHLALAGDRLRDRRVLLQLTADERERRRRRGRPEVGGDLLHVRGLPRLDRSRSRPADRRPRTGRARCRAQPRPRRRRSSAE